MPGKRKRVDFNISGFDCATCTKIVGKALEGVKGVKEINVSYILNRGYVEFDPDVTNEEKIEERLRKRTSLRIARRKG